MKKIKIRVKTEKKGIFGSRTVEEIKTIEVDNKTYRKLLKEQKSQPYSFEELMIYDEIFDEWDN